MTGRPESVRKVSGPTKCFAFPERQTVTRAPAAVSSRSSSTALKAAMEPVTPRTISRPSSMEVGG